MLTKGATTNAKTGVPTVDSNRAEPARRATALVAREQSEELGGQHSAAGIEKRRAEDREFASSTSIHSREAVLDKASVRRGLAFAGAPKPHKLEANPSAKPRRAKIPPRRNTKYERIDSALREISDARPNNHEEVFRSLNDRKVPIPNRNPFTSTRGWLSGFQRDRHAARAWLSQRWAALKLPAFARGPKK
jgi:hypothetical protein